MHDMVYHNILYRKSYRYGVDVYLLMHYAHILFFFFPIIPNKN